MDNEQDFDTSFDDMGPQSVEGYSADKALAAQYAKEATEEAKNEDNSVNLPYEEAAQEVVSQQDQRRKKKNPYQKRIDQLVYEKGAMEQNNAFLAQQLAEKEAYLAQQQARMQDYEAQIHNRDQYANESFEHNLAIQEKTLKERLRQAKEDGDIDKEIDLIDQMAEVKSTRTTHEAWKLQEQQRKAQQLHEEVYEPYETSVQAPNTNVDYGYQEWVANNSWYEANPRLRAEADAIANELKDILSFNNQAHLIGTSEFRDSVTNVMRERYDMNQSKSRQEPESQEDYGYEDSQPHRPAVAPVTRRPVQVNQAQNYLNQRSGSRMGSALTKEEYEMARHLPVRRNEGEMDLIKRYQKAKAYPKSPLPGGSPFRLTII